MNILNKLIIKNLKLNKKRTIGTLIGIILSVALICATAGLFTSFQNTLVEHAIEETGYYHLGFKNIDKEKYDEIKLHKNVQKIDTIYMLGWANFDNVDEADNPYIRVYSIDRTSFDDLQFKLLQGRFPIKNDEIIIGKKALTNGSLKIGDTIELNLGTRMSEDGYKLDETNPYNEEIPETIENPTHKTYKIVGIVDKPSMNSSHFAITVKEENPNDIQAYIALHNPKEYKNTLTEITGARDYNSLINNTSKIDYTINHELLRWEIFAFSDSTITMLYTVCGIVIGIIMITSIFCIRNSFAISTLEKMKMYGMLASVGATKKQIKRSVIREGFILGLIGIPIGILSGIFADAVLIKIVNLIIGPELFQTEAGIVTKISFLSILLAIILGFVVIYFSASSSARKASKVSPIDNLRSTNEIKLTKKNLKTPKIIPRVFKTGGVIAYKNLKRSKKKYRTTVISLTVSIFVFIAMNTFLNEAFIKNEEYYTDLKYNYYILANSVGNDIDDTKLKNILKLDKVDKAYLLYETRESFIIDDLSHVINIQDGREYTNGIAMSPIILDDKTFKTYAKLIGADYNYVKDKGIIYNKYRYYDEKNNKYHDTERYSYKKGDIIKGRLSYDSDEYLNITVGAVTLTPPYGLENTYYNGGYIILNKDYTEFDCYLDKILIESSEPDKLDISLNKLDPTLNTTNIASLVKNQKSMNLIVSIFLYGFITVITLIGVTNIFNTITSNMELRSKEFAILKSIGMTKTEFNRMINLETLFYSFKSLIYGITLGLIGSYLIHKAFEETIESAFVIPINAIIISIIFVLLIVYIIMRYSIAKINKQNTIETIRNENI